MTEASINWVQSIVTQVKVTPCTTIGLIGGSREMLDRRITDRLAKTLVESLRSEQLDHRLLVLRLQLRSATHLEPANEGTKAFEQAGSPLGPWTVVDVDMPVGKVASASFQQLPRYLPQWKKKFGVILMDLGPMNLVPSRALGRLCDASYVVLGPDMCGSAEWIQQQLVWHKNSGCIVSGTILARFKEEAA